MPLYLSSWNTFCRWCASSGVGRLQANPFAGIPKLRESDDQRRNRRAQTEQELSAVFHAARTKPLDDARTIRRGPRKSQKSENLKTETVERLTRLGEERELIYRSLAYTGLRQNELASIRVGNLNLASNPPSFTLNASDEKNGKGVRITVRRDLAEAWAEWIEKNKLAAGDRLLSVPAKLVKILNRDLKYAGIAKVDSEGRTIDVHALRHTFGTMLAKSGAAPKEAQLAMRHSKLELTMNTYVDANLVDVQNAIESIPMVETSTVDDHDTIEMVAIEPDENTWAPKRAPATALCGPLEPSGVENVDQTEFDADMKKPRKTSSFPGNSEVEMRGLEPLTLGLQMRRASIRRVALTEAVKEFTTNAKRSRMDVGTKLGTRFRESVPGLVHQIADRLASELTNRELVMLRDLLSERVLSGE